MATHVEAELFIYRNGSRYNLPMIRVRVVSITEEPDTSFVLHMTDGKTIPQIVEAYFYDNDRAPSWIWDKNDQVYRNEFSAIGPKTVSDSRSGSEEFPRFTADAHIPAKVAGGPNRGRLVCTCGDWNCASLDALPGKKPEDVYGYCHSCGALETKLNKQDGTKDFSNIGESPNYPMGFGCELCS